MTCKNLRSRPVGWLLIIIVLQLIITTVPTAAQTSSWVNTGGGSYTKASNWNPADVPDALGENANFNLADTYTVQILPSSSITLDYLSISNGNVTFSTGNSLGDATLNASQGIFIQEGNLTLARVGVTTDVHLNTDYGIGVRGGSTLAILDGATVMADLVEVSINNNNIGGPDGSILIDGAGSTLTAINEVRLGTEGPAGTGTLTIQNAATVSSPTGSIGFISGSTGIATLNGAGSAWMASDSLYVGGSNVSAGGTGTLTITDQGLVDVAGTLKIWNSGTVTLDGGSIVTNAFDNTDGGVFDFTAGSLTMNDSLAIGAGGLLGENRTLGFNQSVTTTGTTTVETGRLLTMGGGSLSTNNLIVNGGFHFDRGTLELTGGSISGISSLVIPANGEFRAAGFQTAFQVVGLAGSTITPSGDLTIGDGGSLDGFDFAGRLDVGAHAVFLNSGGPANLGTLTTINGGVLDASNGIVLGAGDSLDGNGTVSDKVAAASGSLIRVSTGIVSLEMGDSNALDGFVSDGHVDAGVGTIRLLDANQAVLGSQNSLGVVIPTVIELPGTIEAPNGAILNFGRGITGFGTVDTPDDPTRPTIVNGSVEGYDASHPLTLTGYVKGVGTMNNVVITGTDAPGLSPAAVNRGSVVYDGTLEIELGGTTPGNSFDQLNHILGAGIADLGGTLDVQLIDGFAPSAGDTFEILTAASILDTFDTLSLPPLPGDLLWFINYGATSVNLVSTYAADFDEDGDVDSDDQGAWAGGFGFTSATHMTGDANADTFAGGFDFLTWQQQFGSPGGAPVVATTTSIPEPSSLLLVNLTGVLFSARRRHA